MECLNNILLDNTYEAFFAQAMFTLYRIGVCSFSKVAPAQCEQELMFCFDM